MSKNVLGKLYGDVVERVRKEQAARSGQDTLRDLSVRRPKEDFSELNQRFAEEAERKEAERAERVRKAEEERVKGEALSKWRAGGGTDAAFEEEWPNLHKQILAKRIVEEAEANQGTPAERVLRSLYNGKPSES